MAVKPKRKQNVVERLKQKSPDAHEPVKGQPLTKQLASMISDARLLFCFSGLDSKGEAAVIDTVRKGILFPLAIQYKIGIEASSIRVSFLQGCLEVSFNIDSSAKSPAIIKGPVAGSKDAADFRAFWGDSMCQMRRFKDGRVLECVSFPPTMSQEDIVKSLILLRMQAQLKDNHCVEMSTPSGTVSGNLLPGKSSDAITRQHTELMTEFEGLKNLFLVEITSSSSSQMVPLKVVKVRPCHRRFTHCELGFTKKSNNNNNNNREPLDVVIEFETSNAWPVVNGQEEDDETAEAIYYTKLALLLSLRKAIQQIHPDTLCNVGRTTTGKCVASSSPQGAFLDIVCSSSDRYTFRIFIACPLDSISHGRPKDSEDHNGIINWKGYELVFQPAIREWLLTMFSPIVSQGTILAKAWLDNHLLLFPWLQDWCEVTVMYVYQQYNQPKSPYLLFLTWLAFLAEHPYSTEIIHFPSPSVSQLLTSSTHWTIVIPDIDEESLWIRKPTGKESIYIQTMATNAVNKLLLLTSSNNNNTTTSTGLTSRVAKCIVRDDILKNDIANNTNRGDYFDLILKFPLNSIVSIEFIAKCMKDHFKQIMSPVEEIYYSYRKRLIGIRANTIMDSSIQTDIQDLLNGIPYEIVAMGKKN